MRLSSRPNIEKLKARANIDGLIRALGYRSDARVRHEALEALVEIGKPAIAPLIDALEDARLRDAAVHALVIIGVLAIDPLILALRHTSVDVRAAAANALARIGMLAVDPLIVALKHKSWSVREAAIQALSQVGSMAEEPLISTFQDVDEKDYARRAAAEALLKSGRFEWVANAFFNAQGDMRQGLAEILGRSEDARAVEPLVRALKDRDGKTRQTVATALGQLGQNRAVQPLLAAFRQERDAAVRQEMQAALEQLGWQLEKPKPETAQSSTPVTDFRNAGHRTIVPAHGWRRLHEILPRLKAMQLKPLPELMQSQDPDTRVKAFADLQALMRDLHLEFNNYSRFYDLKFGDRLARLIFDDHMEVGASFVPPTRQLEVTIVSNGNSYVVFYNTTSLTSSSWDRVLTFLPRLQTVPREVIIRLRAENSDARAFSDPRKVVHDLRFESDSYPNMKQVKYDVARITLTFDNSVNSGPDVVPATKQLDAIIVTNGKQFFVFYTARFVELW